MTDRLPAELAKVIASHCGSVKDARNLAQTNTKWQAASEPSIWQNIHVLHASPRIGHVEVSEEPLSKKMSAADWNSLIALRPQRSQYVRRITTDGITHERLELSQMMELIQAVAPRLNYLDITVTGLSKDRDGIIVLFEALSENCHFPNLSTLRLRYVTRALGTISKILKNSPKIKRLDFETEWDYRHDIGEEPDWPEMAHLEQFHAEYRDGSHSTFNTLLQKAPNLSAVWIVQTDSCPWSQGDAELFVSAPKLEYLRLCYTMEEMWDRWTPSLSDPRGFERLDTLYLQMPQRAGRRTPRPFRIPSMPRLRTIVMQNFDVGIPWPDLKYTMTDEIFKQLEAAPKLENILSTWHDVPPIFQPYELAGHISLSTWMERDIEGIAIRSYTNGAETLYHLRRCTRVEKIVWPGHYETEVAPGYMWMNSACYSGGRIGQLDECLSRVYKMIGEPVNFSSTGRDIELPAEAWDLLRTERQRYTEWEQRPGGWSSSRPRQGGFDYAFLNLD